MISTRVEHIRNRLKKVIDAIENSKQVPFDRVLFALGIRFVGETSARLLARKFNDINSLRNATAAQLLEVEGVGDIIAASVVSFFADEKNIALIERLESYGLQMAMPVIEEGPKGNVLEGKTIVISGVFTHHRRCIASERMWNLFTGAAEGSH